MSTFAVFVTLVANPALSRHLYLNHLSDVYGFQTIATETRKMFLFYTEDYFSTSKNQLKKGK
jgi:hypothetical protein